MGEPTDPPHWLRTWASDVAPGDLIKFHELGDAVRVLDRDYPPVYDFTFRVRLDGDATKTLAKSSRIRIFDPDGTVARRLQVALGCAQ